MRLPARVLATLSAAIIGDIVCSQRRIQPGYNLQAEPTTSREYRNPAAFPAWGGYYKNSTTQAFPARWDKWKTLLFVVLAIGVKFHCFYCLSSDVNVLSRR